MGVSIVPIDEKVAKTNRKLGLAIPDGNEIMKN
jgi:hypothetical protein